MGKSAKIIGSTYLILFSITNLICVPAVKPTEAVHQKSGGKPYDFSLDVYKSKLYFPGTTVFVDSTNPKNPYIIEIDMQGKVLWDYEIPKSILRGCNISKGPDIEWIPKEDHFLFVLPYKGVYEINRQKQIVWRYETAKVSHDADRLTNGNTLIVWGWDRKEDAQVTEVSSEGKIIWKWFAKDFLKDQERPRPFSANWGGYFHANSATRLSNGNTLISLKEFDMVVEVGPAGDIVWSLGDLNRVHDPKVLDNGNILLSAGKPHRTTEVTREGRIVWRFQRNDIRTITYTHRLPNGNTLIVEHTKMIELSPKKETVWQISKKNVAWDINPKTENKNKLREWAKLRHQWFYKAERLPLQK